MKSSEDSGADESSQSASVSADQPDKLHYFNVQLTYFMLFCDLTSVQFDVTVNFFVTSWEKHKTLPTWDQLWQKPLLQALLRADGLLNQTPFKKQVFYGRDTCFLSETVADTSQSFCSVGTRQYRRSRVIRPLIFPSFFGGGKRIKNCVVRYWLKWKMHHSSYQTSSSNTFTASVSPWRAEKVTYAWFHLQELWVRSTVQWWS